MSRITPAQWAERSDALRPELFHENIAPVQGTLVGGHTMFAEYGEGGECYIEITDASGELVYSNRGDSPVKYTLYDVIIQN